MCNAANVKAITVQLLLRSTNPHLTVNNLEKTLPIIAQSHGVWSEHQPFDAYIRKQLFEKTGIWLWTKWRSRKACYKDRGNITCGISKCANEQHCQWQRDTVNAWSGTLLCYCVANRNIVIPCIFSVSWKRIKTLRQHNKWRNREHWYKAITSTSANNHIEQLSTARHTENE